MALVIGACTATRNDITWQDVVLSVALLAGVFCLIGPPVRRVADDDVARVDTSLDAALGRVDDALLKVDRRIQRLEQMIKEMEEATDWRGGHWRPLE